MTSDLEALVAWLSSQREAVRIVVLTGSGQAFCSGDDVKELPSLSMEDARALSLRQANLYLAFEQLPQPIIAAVNGPALGAGCVAAISCDFRIATHQAIFGMPEIKLGWPPGYGISQLTNLVGKARALELCLTGDPISAKIAHEWGLVHEVVSANNFWQPLKSLQNASLQCPPKLFDRQNGYSTGMKASFPKSPIVPTPKPIFAVSNSRFSGGDQRFFRKASPQFKGFNRQRKHSQQNQQNLPLGVFLTLIMLSCVLRALKPLICLSIPRISTSIGGHR